MFTLLCSSTCPHPTSVVFPKFSHVPLGIGGWPLGYKKRRWLVIVHAISFQDFQPTCSWYTNVMDGQTDGRTDDSNRNTTFCTIVHRAVKTSYRPGLCPGPPSGGAYVAPPDPLVGWGGSIPAHTFPPSTPSASSTTSAS